MSRRYRTFSREFKLEVVRQIEEGHKSHAQSCREYSLSDALLRRWRDQYAEKGEDAFRASSDGEMWELEQARRRIAELESSLGRAHLEVELLRRVLSKKTGSGERGGP